jgi:ATP-dependent Zn protease
MMDELWRDTLRLVRLNWRAVQRVADALLDRGTLQGDEVRAIIERRNP